MNKRQSEDIDNKIDRRTKDIKRSQKTEWIDDGRVIADMSVDGMPGTLSETMFGRSRPKQPRIDDQGFPIPAPEPIQLSRAEKREIRVAVTRAFMLVGGGIALFYTLLMLFLVNVWMR